MASGVPASYTGRVPQARRVDGVPAVGRRPKEVSAAPDRRNTRTSIKPRDAKV